MRFKLDISSKFDYLIRYMGKVVCLLHLKCGLITNVTIDYNPLVLPVPHNSIYGTGISLNCLTPSPMCSMPIPLLDVKTDRQLMSGDLLEGSRRLTHPSPSPNEAHIDGTRC